MHQHPRGDKLLPVKVFWGIGMECHRDSKEPVDALFLGVPAQLFQPVLVGAFGVLGQFLFQVDPVGQTLVGDLQLQAVQAYQDIQGDLADALIGVGHPAGEDHTDDFGDDRSALFRHPNALGQLLGVAAGEGDELDVVAGGDRDDFL